MEEHLMISSGALLTVNKGQMEQDVLNKIKRNINRKRRGNLDDIDSILNKKNQITVKDIY